MRCCFAVVTSEMLFFPFCISVQECGKQLSDQPGSQCFPLDSHLLCHSCHMSRVCASHNLPPHNTHWTGGIILLDQHNTALKYICIFVTDYLSVLKYLLFSCSFPPPAHKLQIITLKRGGVILLTDFSNLVLHFKCGTRRRCVCVPLVASKFTDRVLLIKLSVQGWITWQPY